MRSLAVKLMPRQGSFLQGNKYNVFESMTDHLSISYIILCVFSLL